MKNGKTFEQQIHGGDFMVTAEYLPEAETGGAAVKSAIESLRKVPSGVNVSDNPFGVVMSSMAASVLLMQSDIEPIYQIVTRDRNRIAIQSDLLGAASLGIRNILCLSGYHQALTDNPESANVYDIDSTQLLALVDHMRTSGELQNGTKFEGAFPVNIGAAVNPAMRPLDLNMLRMMQKVECGAAFVQTQPVFDTDEFNQWMDGVRQVGLADRAAVLAGVLPLQSVEEAERLRNTYTEFQIPDRVVDRLKAAGDGSAQKKEGFAICLETIQALRSVKGVRGIHIFSGGQEENIPGILDASGLADAR